MTDINGNFNNFESKGDYNKPIKKNISEESIGKKELNGELKSFDTMPAADVLGRSQVASPKGSNPTKSVDEAIDTIAKLKDNPAILSASDEIFDIAYDKAIKAGSSSEEAYFKASMASNEFLKLAESHA